MRFVREVIADRLSGGVLALLIAFMLMLDGAIGAHAQASMAAAEHVAAAEIICSSGAADEQGHHHDHRGKGERPECCSAACQFAAQFAATDLPIIPLPQWPLPLQARTTLRDADLVLLRPAGLFKDARGPPSFSI